MDDGEGASRRVVMETGNRMTSGGHLNSMTANDGWREMRSRVFVGALDPEWSAPQVHAVVTEAIQSRCAGVLITPVRASRVGAMLQGSDVRVAAAVGFPHGTSKPTIKAIEATSGIKDGAEQIAVVAHLPYLLGFDLDAARAELLEVVRAARATRRDVVIRVIVESALLMARHPDRGEQAIELACRAVRESACDVIQTSTGFHPAGGASVEAVAMMKKHGDGLRVVASGGIGDFPSARAMLLAGADELVF